MAFQVADTETKGPFMVSQLCLLCPPERVCLFFFNVISLLNLGFKAIFIQHKVCMERKRLEIEDRAICFSSKSPLCLGEVKQFSGKPR